MSGICQQSLTAQIVNDCKAFTGRQARTEIDEAERLSVAIDDVPEFIGVEIRLSLF